MAFAETLAAFQRGENDEAGRLAQLDLAAAREVADAPAEVDALCMLARVALRSGDLVAVGGHASEAAEVAQRSGEARLGRMPLHMRAVAARMSERADEARQLYLESIALNEALGETRMVAVEHRNLAYVELHTGDLPRTRELIAACRELLAGGDPGALAPYLAFDEATIASIDGDNVTAAAKLAEAERQFAALGIVPDPDDAAEIDSLRGRLG